MPVRFVAHQLGLPVEGPITADRMSGTVWHGRVEIDGGHDLTWTMRPRASLLNWGFAADVHVTGPGTDLAGQAVLRGNGARIGPLAGVASWPLIAGVMPGLRIACSGQARFAAIDLRISATERTGAGTVTAPAGECARLDGRFGPVPVPALHAQISTLPDAVQVLVTPQDGPRVALLTAQLTQADRLVVTIHRAGAALVPGMPNTADSALDLPLSVLLNM